MGQTDRQATHGFIDTLQQREKITRVSAATTLEAWQTTVIAEHSGDGAYTITLPNVSKAAGRIFSIRREGAGANNITVDDDGTGSASTYTFDAAGEVALLYSDGIRWHQLRATATAS